MASISHQRANDKYTDQYVVQVILPLLVIDQWFETLDESLLAQKIWEYPHIISENYAHQINDEPNDYQADQDYQKDEGNEPNPVFQLIRPNRKQDQRKHGHNYPPHHPPFGLCRVETETCVLLITMVCRYWL